jgi:hypothetical protein
MKRTVEDVLKDIKEHPENHRHNFNGLQTCCIIDGALDMLLIEAHQEFAGLGTNGGQTCDVISGPCSCGAWH